MNRSDYWLITSRLCSTRNEVAGNKVTVERNHWLELTTNVCCCMRELTLTTLMLLVPYMNIILTSMTPKYLSHKVSCLLVGFVQFLFLLYTVIFRLYCIYCFLLYMSLKICFTDTSRRAVYLLFQPILF